MATHQEQTSISSFVSLDAEAGGALADDLQRLLHAIRTHLGMEVAFVAEFADGRRIFRSVDAGDRNPPIRPGMGDPLEQSYCQRVVDGRLPELIPDTSVVPETQELPVTRSLPVGAHLSVPIRLTGGNVFGTFCCFSRSADPSLNERDIQLMRVFAEIAAQRIDRDSAANRARHEMRERIRAALDEDALNIVYQPIFNAEEGTVGGFEALTRFTISPFRTPDVWFNEAATVGSGVELELKAAAKALEGFKALPTGVYLSINLSPDSIIHGRLEATLAGVPLDRLVFEVTEHSVVTRYADLAQALEPWREKGIRVAVDDAGAGFASFRHILNLKPEIIKLDNDLTRNLDKDPARLALASALAVFGRETGSDIVAEGVESASELKVLRSLGIAKAQGYYLGRPVPLETAVDFCHPNRPVISGFLS